MKICSGHLTEPDYPYIIGAHMLTWEELRMLANEMSIVPGSDYMPPASKQGVVPLPHNHGEEGLHETANPGAHSAGTVENSVVYING